MGAFLSLAELKDGPAMYDFLPVPDKLYQHVLEVKELRLTTDNSKHDHPKGDLHLGMLVKLVEHNLGNRVFFQFDDDSDSMAIRFIPEVRNPEDLFIPYQFGNFFQKSGFIY